jgi:hypothetical protein
VLESPSASKRSLGKKGQHLFVLLMQTILPLLIGHFSLQLQKNKNNQTKYTFASSLYFYTTILEHWSKIKKFNIIEIENLIFVITEMFLLQFSL